jgi:hypothetical protein
MTGIDICANIIELRANDASWIVPPLAAADCPDGQVLEDNKIMLEKILKGLTGRWGLVALALALTPTGRKLAKAAAKEVIKATVIAGEKVKEITEEIREEGSGLIAELKEERAKLSSNGKKDKKEEEEAST